MAQVLYDEIRKMNRNELYSWSKARDLEEPVGGINELAYLAAPFLISYADDLWFLIESMALPENREVAHYEGLRGQRMRLSPEVKELRKRARVEELRLEEEAEKHRRIEVLMRRADELRAAAKAARERELIGEQRSPEH